VADAEGMVAVYSDKRVINTMGAILRDIVNKDE
jgi:hypothetical protein